MTYVSSSLGEQSVTATCRIEKTVWNIPHNQVRKLLYVIETLMCALFDFGVATFVHLYAYIRPKLGFPFQYR